MPDPSASAKAGPALPRRFYKLAAVHPGVDGFVLTLDGRPARTPGRASLTLPTAELGAAVAAEWERQGDTIDPSTMPLTRLANSTIDGVAPRAGEVRDEIVRYAGSDLVCYRAGEPQSLVAAQSAAWDPVVAWAREALEARMALAEGVMFVAQPADALARIGEAVAAERSPFRLAALHVLTTLSGSALMALMVAAGRLSVEDAWRAAHVDEFYQESLWGEDLDATRRRERRLDEFRSAAQMLRLAG